MSQFKISKTRLTKLMNESNIKAYKLSQILEKKGYSISTNTITSYMKGKHPPKNLEYVKAIADFFNVSTDYLLGIAPTPTNNIAIKDLCNKYGLSENSLKALESANKRNNNFNLQEISTINHLLEDLYVNKENSIIVALTDYLYLNNIDNTQINIQTRINGMNKNLKISKDFILEELLLKDVTYKMNNLKNTIIKEGEK